MDVNTFKHIQSLSYRCKQKKFDQCRCSHLQKKSYLPLLRCQLTFGGHCIYYMFISQPPITIQTLINTDLYVKTTYLNFSQRLSTFIVTRDIIIFICQLPQLSIKVRRPREAQEAHLGVICYFWLNFLTFCSISRFFYKKQVFWWPNSMGFWNSIWIILS